MAIINGLYLHVIEENIDREVETSSHPVEKGVDLSDLVRSKGFTLSINGRIVDYGNIKAASVIDKLNEWMKKGSLVNYSGRNSCKAMQITGFSTAHSKEVWGGAEFDLSLKEVRIAKSAYVPKPVVSPEKREDAKKNPQLKVGEIVVFKGGGVYVSSDAKKPAATRGRSSCKITIISTASYSKHGYHLISCDGKGVWGWVDKENIEGSPGPQANSKTNGGTKSITKR